MLRRRDFTSVEAGILRKAGKSEEETKQDMKWSGVKENLMVISNTPRGRNTAISFGMKGMSQEVVESCRVVPKIGEVSEAGGVQQHM